MCGTECALFEHMHSGWRFGLGDATRSRRLAIVRQWAMLQGMMAQVAASGVCSVVLPAAMLHCTACCMLHCFRQAYGGVCACRTVSVWQFASACAVVYCLRARCMHSGFVVARHSCCCHSRRPCLLWLLVHIQYPAWRHAHVALSGMGVIFTHTITHTSHRSHRYMLPDRLSPYPMNVCFPA